MSSLDPFLPRIEKALGRREIEVLLEEMAPHFGPEDLVSSLLQVAEARRSDRLLSFANIANKTRPSGNPRVTRSFARRIVAADWSHVCSDGIGTFIQFGCDEDIPFLAHQATRSTRTWLLRNDENQQFFRKCVQAITEIGKKTAGGTAHLEALQDLSAVDSEMAAYWAKKSLDRELEDKSPFQSEDLSAPPEPDLEWPGNRRSDLLIHSIFAEHDAETITVYQAYSDAIGKAAAREGRLDVGGFSKSRMTWIKPSFLWMMYRCGWGEKDSGQTTVLKLKLRRPEFSYLIERATLSHATGQSPEDWNRLKAENPNRIQWDPDRDGAGNPLDRRAIQIGIGSDLCDFYVTRAVRNIEDITDQVHSLRNRSERARMLPEEPLFWPSLQ